MLVNFDYLLVEQACKIPLDVLEGSRLITLLSGSQNYTSQYPLTWNCFKE